MALRDPVAVYNAANNMQAQFVCDALAVAGVEAYVTEDISQVGVWVGGLVPEIHKPQVWVERADVERAGPVLIEFERRAAELRGNAADTAGPPVEAVCEECGESASFPVAQRGTVQQCPHCGEYMDVGGDDLPPGWEEDEREPEQT